MIILKNEARLQMRLASTVNSNQLQFCTTYYDGPSSSYGEHTGLSDNTSEVVLADQTIGQYREIKFVSIVNTDDAAATVIVEIKKDASTTQLFEITLQVLDVLFYNNSGGYQVITKNGATKTV